MRPPANSTLLRVPVALVAVDRHQPELAGIAKRASAARVVARQVGIAVEDEECVAQQRQRRPQRAGRAEQLRAVERVLDLQPEARAVARELLESARPDSPRTAPRARSRARRSSRSWWARNGSPATSTSALGIVSVSGPQARGAVRRPGWRSGSMHSRTASPTCVPSKSKRMRTSRSPASRQRVAQARLVLGVEHQEAAAAGADQLAAERAVGARQLVPARRSRSWSSIASGASCAPSARA